LPYGVPQGVFHSFTNDLIKQFYFRYYWNLRSPFPEKDDHAWQNQPKTSRMHPLMEAGMRGGSDEITSD
jgi:hypothetical protein